MNYFTLIVTCFILIKYECRNYEINDNALTNICNKIKWNVIIDSQLLFRRFCSKNIEKKFFSISKNRHPIKNYRINNDGIKPFKYG